MKIPDEPNDAAPLPKTRDLFKLKDLQARPEKAAGSKARILWLLIAANPLRLINYVWFQAHYATLTVIDTTVDVIGWLMKRAFGWATFLGPQIQAAMDWATLNKKAAVFILSLSAVAVDTFSEDSRVMKVLWVAASYTVGEDTANRILGKQDESFTTESKAESRRKAAFSRDSLKIYENSAGYITATENRAKALLAGEEAKTVKLRTVADSQILEAAILSAKLKHQKITLESTPKPEGSNDD